ncbi:MAG: C25 family peptidase propeptide domain-containing protein [Candidatus Helarchaeota archaeon]
MRSWIGKKEGSIPKKKSKLIEKETSVIKVKYETKGFWDIDVPVEGKGTYAELQIPNIGQNLEPGEPAVPQEGLYVAIPEGATVKNISILKTKKKTYKLKNKIKPAPEPTTDPSGVPALNPKQEIYEKDEAYPGFLFNNLGVKQVGDVTVVHLMMYPVQVYPMSNTVDLYSTIELGVEYELAEKAPPIRGGPPMRGIPTRGRKRVPEGYDEEILNFDNV